MRKNNHVLSYRFGDFIRKEENKTVNKPDDIGTKPIPKWVLNNSEFKELFKDENEILKL